MSTPSSYPPPAHPSRPVGASAPPAPVRAAITLLWVKLALWVVSAAALVLVPSVRDRFVSTTGEPSAGLMTAFLVLLAVFAILATLYVAAWTTVVTALLRRGHRWVRTVVLVFATLTALGLVGSVLQWLVYATTGVVVQSDTAPSLLTALYALVSTALFAGVLVLLFRPASRRWLDERTSQRRSAVQHRRAATTSGAR